MRCGGAPGVTVHLLTWGASTCPPQRGLCLATGCPKSTSAGTGLPSEGCGLRIRSTGLPMSDTWLPRGGTRIPKDCTGLPFDGTGFCPGKGSDCPKFALSCPWRALGCPAAASGCHSSCRELPQQNPVTAPSARGNGHWCRGCCSTSSAVAELRSTAASSSSPRHPNPLECTLHPGS